MNETIPVEMYSCSSSSQQNHQENLNYIYLSQFAHQSLRNFSLTPFRCELQQFVVPSNHRYDEPLDFT